MKLLVWKAKNISLLDSLKCMVQLEMTMGKVAFELYLVVIKKHLRITRKEKVYVRDKLNRDRRFVFVGIVGDTFD